MTIIVIHIMATIKVYAMLVVGIMTANNDVTVLRS